MFRISIPATHEHMDVDDDPIAPTMYFALMSMKRGCWEEQACKWWNTHLAYILYHLCFTENRMTCRYLMVWQRQECSKIQNIYRREVMSGKKIDSRIGDSINLV